MQRELIRKRIVELVGNMSIEAYDNINKVRIFSYLFDEIGLGYFFNRGKNGYELAIEASEEPLTEERNKIIEYVSTVDNLIAAFDGIKFQIHASEMYVVGDNIVIRINSNISNERKIEGIDVATNRDDLETIGKLIESSLVIKESLNDENSYKIAYKGQYSIETTVCKFNDWETNLKKNYNDDLPYNAMNDVIRSDKAGLIMFYGIPGTGKTSLVKTLINDNRDTDFIFVDTSVCESISDGLFLDFLQEHKNSVIVFEDCEKLLFSRDEMVNESIGTILNLTDGIIAESMKIKFICTFNCDLEKVDKALLRKGRLTIGYEFKKLSLEKTKAIYPDAKEEMTLADAHNASVNNGYEEKKRKSIGFH